MKATLLNTLLPKTLFGRSALLIAAVVLLAQLMTGTAYHVLFQRPRVELLADFAITYIDNIRAALDAMPASQREVFLKKLDQSSEMRITRDTLGKTKQGEVLQPLVRTLIEQLQKRLQADETILLQVQPERALWVSLRTQDREQFWLVISLTRLRPEFTLSLLVPMLLISAMSILGGLWLHYSLNRPLRKLQGAVHAVGRGDKAKHITPEGPTEVIELTTAFNRMVGDLEQAEADRRIMLAGVSHDLRTPVTRLRLALELMQHKPSEELATRMEKNLDEIDAALTQFLDFARDERDEALIKVDLRDIAQECVASYESLGHAIAVELPAAAVSIPCRPQALTRALRNLIDNALKYSQGHITVQVLPPMAGQGAALCVRDEGEKLHEAELARLRQPFTRRFDSRTGPPGTGLGLAIVDRIAQMHHAKLHLQAREAGGLEARIVFIE